MSKILNFSKKIFLSDNLAYKVKKTRKISCILFIIVFLTQFFPQAYNGFASGPRDYDENAVIYGGAYSISELVGKINNGDGKHKNLDDLFAKFGIYTVDLKSQRIKNGEVTKSGNVIVGGKVVASGVYSAGRHNLKGSTYWNGLYWRHPSVSFVPSSLDAFVYMDGSKFGYAIIKSCGNPVLKSLSPLKSNLTIDKQVYNVTRDQVWRNSNRAQEGDILEYRISFKNTGSVSSINTIVRDVLSQKVSLVSSSGRLTVGERISQRLVSNSHITSGENFGVLYPQESGHLNFRVRVNSNLSCGSNTITNVGYIRSSNNKEISDPAQTSVSVICAKQEYSLTVFKFNDLNRNGINDSGEPGLRGIQISLRGPVSRVENTNSAGYVVFQNLPPGTYTVSETVPQGWVNTTPQSVNVNLNQNRTVTFGNFQLQPVFRMTKSAFNDTQGVDATSEKANPGDMITYSLEVENTGQVSINNFIVTDNIADVLEYADVIDSGGGTVSGGVISYPAQNIPVGERITRNFTVRVKNPLPQNPQNGSSFDLVMENVYGNRVRIEIQPPRPVPVILGAQVARLAAAGANNTILFVLMTFMFLSSVFLYVRERLLLIYALRNI